MKKFGQHLLHFIKAVIPVLVGVLLALYIGNWNLQRNNKQYVNQMLHYISKDLTDSQEAVKDNMQKQKALLQAVETSENNPSRTIGEVIGKAGGIYASPLNLTAWRSVAANKIELIDYERVSLLSTLEEANKLLQQKADRVVNHMVQNMDDTSKEKKVAMTIFLKDLIGTEQGILKGIDEYQKLDKKDK